MSSKVLVIEPFADLRMEIAATLRRERYACDAVATAEEAAAELSARPYEFVIVDLYSTGDFASTVSGDARVILLTEDESYCGSHPTLLKPFTRADLLARVTN